MLWIQICEMNLWNGCLWENSSPGLPQWFMIIPNAKVFFWAFSLGFSPCDQMPRQLWNPGAASSHDRYFYSILKSSNFVFNFFSNILTSCPMTPMQKMELSSTRQEFTCSNYSSNPPPIKNVFLSSSPLKRISILMGSKGKSSQRDTDSNTVHTCQRL